MSNSLCANAIASGLPSVRAVLCGSFIVPHGGRFFGKGAMGMERLSPVLSSLAQVNGWGSAGECPASSSAKTPAAGARCFRVAGVGAWHGGGIFSHCVSLQRQAGGGVG